MRMADQKFSQKRFVLKVIHNFRTASCGNMDFQMAAEPATGETAHL
jgi:hypothetical protein